MLLFMKIKFKVSKAAIGFLAELFNCLVINEQMKWRDSVAV